MQNRMSVGAVLLTVSCGSLLGLVRAYDVAPVKAAWSGWTHRGSAISEFVTCNFDSLAYVELFAGELGDGSQYMVTVLDDGKELTRSNGIQMRHHVWVTFEDWSACVAFTKGKKYEFRFTRSGGESIQYYYDSLNPDHYGGMIAPNRQSMAPTCDLAVRCYGRLSPVGDVWRACTNHGQDPRGTERDAALSKAASMGVRWLRDDFLSWDGWMDQRDSVKDIYNRYLATEDSMIGLLCYGRSDSTISSRGTGPYPLSSYPPRNLWAAPESTNYWTEYCRSIMESLPAVRYWEVWPEANANWYWHDPDITFYRDPGGRRIDTPRERCSLYVRMCRIAESTARSLGGDPRRKVIGGGAFRLVDPIANGATGVDWLSCMFNIAKHNYGAAESCFDVVSVHPYMFYPGGEWKRLHFTEEDFRINLDTARWVMRQARYQGMELWATEYGWPRWDRQGSSRPLTDTLMQARNVCKFYISAIARQADPRGGYDRAIHYELTSRHVAWADNDGFGFLDSLPSQPRLPHGWAFTRLGEALAGKRCNGRSIAGDPATDKLVRMYEFEDPATLKRTWVCWKDGEAVQSINVKLPVRTNSLAAESLAYTGTPPTFSPKVTNDGWLSLNLNSRPVFISETESPLRPDLRVDSVRFVQASSIVRAWVTNHGTRATPVRSGSREPYATWAMLRANGDSLAQQARMTSIAVNQQVVFEFRLGQTQSPDNVLLSVTVNPTQTYVELGTDDNTGYALVGKP
jgi:hypothetical protein